MKGHTLGGFSIASADSQGAPGLIPEQIIGWEVAAVHLEEQREDGDELYVLFTNGRVVSFCGDAGYRADSSCSRDPSIHDLAYFDVTETAAGQLMRDRFTTRSTEIR